jgi:retron-type reverse transcriptase
MRRVGHLFERIVDRENLRLAVHKALRGKRSKQDARAFVARLDENLESMRVAIVSGDIALGEYHQFTIFDPKQRLITAPCFRERVLHHAIMNVCEPVFERWLIADTFACRRGKGRLAALHRARDFAGRSAFFLKLDIRKYFESISHEILAARLERLFKDRRLLLLLRRIIAGFESTPARGLPIGSLTSQHFANFYLGWLDRFVKQDLRVSGYVRYMDDCAVWAETSRQLRTHLADMTAFLRGELSLELKPEPYVNRTGHGMDFLGCRVFPRHITLNRRSRVRFRRKLRGLEHAYGNGELEEGSLQQRATAMVAFTRVPGVSSWRYRQGVLDFLPVSGHRPRRE